MSCPLNSDHLSQLKQFILVVKAKPDILHHPDLKFFKDYLETLGAIIPAKPEEPKVVIEEEEVTPPMEEEPKEVESDVELDMEGCIEPDELDPDQFIGDENAVVSEEDCDKSDEKGREAMQAFRDGDYDKSLTLFVEALKLNPVSSLLYARRGNLYLKLNKPNACIKDCTHALKLNPDSPAAFKFRGRAYRLIGEWEKAASDLRQACNIDFDPQADEWLREVTPNVRKIEEHKLKQQRKKAEAELREKQERIRKAREANAKAAEQQPQPEIPSGGMPGGMNPDFMQFLSDPEIMAAFKDPEVAAAFQDISANPANVLKYQSNPKILAIITKLTAKMGGGGMPGGFPGGMPGGFPGGMDPGMFAGGFSGANGDDVGLD